MNGGTDTWTDRQRQDRTGILVTRIRCNSVPQIRVVCSHRHQLCRGERMQQSSGFTQFDQFERRPLCRVHVCVHWTVCSEIPRNSTGNRKFWGTRSKTHLELSTEVETRKTLKTENHLGLLIILVWGCDVIRLMLTRQKERQTDKQDWIFVYWIFIFTFCCNTIGIPPKKMWFFF